MISTKKLVKMAKKWQKFAVIQRKRILFTKEVENVNDDRFASSNPSASSTKGDNGFFVVYSVDGRNLDYIIAMIQRGLAMSVAIPCSLPSQNNEDSSISGRSSLPPVAEKGHFVAYTSDGRRYSIPIAYLQRSIFRELLKMSEEEYGIPNGVPISFPCNSIFMDCIISLSKRKTTKDVEAASLLSIAANNCASQNNEDPSTSGRSSLPSVAKKGHFVAYTSDGRRYSIPIAYLKSSIFRKLLKMSEEEYGIPKAGPITFPCISIFMDYIISLTPRKTTKDVEEALLLSVAANKCLSGCTVYQQETSQHALLYGF